MIAGPQNHQIKSNLMILEDEKDKDKSSIKDKSPERSLEIKEKGLKSHKDNSNLRKSDSKLIQVDIKFDNYSNEKFKNILTSKIK